MKISISSSKAAKRGFTLFEMIVATGAGGLLFAAVAVMMMYGGKSTAMMGNYVALDQSDRDTLDTITTDIRQANMVTSYATNQLQLQTTDVNTGATNTLTYTYNATNGTLTRVLSPFGVASVATNTTTTLILSNIVANKFSFGMYQRNPIRGVVDQYTTTNASLCKVVQVSWTCSKSVLGIGETESVQSAKIVIRKE